MGADLITLDTSGLFALLNRRELTHSRVASTLRKERPPYTIPAATLGEVAYLVEQQLGMPVLDDFLSDLVDGKFVLDCGDGDFQRVQYLVRRYADLPLGLVDAAVIACAERNGGRVLTLDLRHFGVVAKEGTLTLLP
jgi:predicted nucleic acid-binding protein